MTEYWNLHEIVAAAQRKLSRSEWDFLLGGTETETTLRRNRLALDSLAFRPRVLRDVHAISCRRSVLGVELRLPVLLAPIGNQPHGGGPLAAARAAAGFGCGFMLSSVNPQARIEDVGPIGSGNVTIYQLYVRGDRDWIRAHVDRAVAQGCEAFCVTVDTPIISRRERDFVNRFTSDRRRHFEGKEFQAAFDWSGLEQLRADCPLPLIVKGIQAPQDAERAVEIGADVIYVSNHGGRQADHCIGSVDALAEIAPLIAGRARLFVDGGIARGSDIVKALALGADAVGIGKLFCLALAADGERGVIRMLELLEDEVEICLSLLGIADLAELDSSCLRGGTPLVLQETDLGRAFPLLALRQ